MSAFEFFFSFYGLLLGFSVAELVGGFTRLLHERKAVKFGWLTPMLAVFVALDIATFWNQAWVIFRGAPYNMSLLVLGLFVASIFYVAASMVFPRALAARTSLDSHFWAHRRLIFLGVLTANLTVAAAFMILTTATGELASLNLPPIFWAGLVLFTVASLVAALAPWKRVAVAALVLLLAYQAFTVGRSVQALVEGGGWSIRAAASAS